jgi:(p)ppGpp synthase/HD superfamily hydrolase
MTQPVDLNLKPWKPIPTQPPIDWMVLAEALAEQARGLQHTYVLRVRYDAQRVGNLLCSWGLPWQVVMAGYLWEHDEKQIRSANLPDVDQVLNHITQANLYMRYIEEENLPDLLAPPYHDLGALLIAVAVYYQTLQILLEQSNEQPYTGVMQSQIESVGRTLLNIGKRLGMWYFKRDVEDLTEQLRSPRRFAEANQQRALILERDASMLEDVRQLLIAFYQEATQQRIAVFSSVCGIAGMKRFLQDVNTTATTQETQLTGFDLVTFHVMASTVQECYSAFGMLRQLGYIQGHVTDLIANPKANGCSNIVNYGCQVALGHFP